MKTDAYMRFYGGKFLNAVRGRPRASKWAYLVASWYYWAEHCEGLDNDDEFLRDLCECNDVEWPVTRSHLFDVEGRGWFQLMDDGRWHHLFLLELKQKANTAAAKMSAGAIAAATRRWPATGHNDHKNRSTGHSDQQK